MNSGENALATMCCQNPEYVPYVLGITAPVDPAEYWDFDASTHKTLGQVVAQ